MKRRQLLTGITAGLPCVTGCLQLLNGEENTIDPSNLETYTNQQYSYSVKYPGGWTKQNAGEHSTARISFFQVGFAPPETAGIMLSQAIHTPPQFSQAALDPFITRFLKGGRRTFTTFEPTHRRTVTLPNGHSGTAVDLIAKKSDTPFRGNAVFGFANETIYDVLILVPQHMDTIDNALTTIITSLTISGQ